MRVAIPAGIGLFIAFLGLQNAKLVIPSTSTGVTLGSFNLLTDGSWASIMPMIVTVLALLAIAIMSQRKVRGAVLWGILGGSVLYYILGFTVPGFYDGFAANMSFDPFAAFSEFGTQAFGKVFTEGFDFSAFIAANGVTNLVLLIVTTSLAFCMVDMFDTIGTLYVPVPAATCSPKRVRFPI